MLQSGARERRLREAFTQRGIELVQLYRHGPFRLEALFKRGAAGYWPVQANVNREQPWTQEQLDAQLDNALIDALDQWLNARAT